MKNRVVGRRWQQGNAMFAFGNVAMIGWQAYCFRGTACCWDCGHEKDQREDQSGEKPGKTMTIITSKKVINHFYNK